MLAFPDPDAELEVSDTCHAIFFIDRQSPTEMVLAVDTASSVAGRRILAPVRAVPHGLERQPLLRKAHLHAQNLRRKLQTLDILRISPQALSPQFLAGRILLSQASTTPDEVAWQFAARCIKAAEKHLRTTLITQPDYDQKRYHKILGGLLDGIDFKTLHDPSAMGTVTSFRVVMEQFGARKQPSFGLVGVGELGLRILKLLRAATAAKILICDHDPGKVIEASRSAEVIAVSFERMISDPIDAVIFCADSGSLSESAASTLAMNRRLAVAGGPEAGLDHSKAALRKLAKAKKQFVPSVLCGAMGLVANLMELNGEQVHLDEMTAALEARILEICAQARARSVCFHEAFVEYLIAGSSVEE